MDRDLVRRCQRAAVDAYADAYGAAKEIGAGREWLGEALAVWNPLDESPAYTCLMGAESSSDPIAAWRSGRAMVPAGVSAPFGVMITPEMRVTVSADRARAVGLAFAEEELVWVRPLGEGEEHDVSLPGNARLKTGGFTPRAFAALLNSGWELPAGHGRGLLYAATAGMSNWTHYVGLVSGHPVAAAVLAIYDGIAVCMVAATVPASRGQGWQGVMIRRRLQDATSSGCEAAFVETVVGNASARNVERAGFSLLHRREVWS